MMSNELVRLWERFSPDRRRVIYYLDYVDNNGKRVRKSLHHGNKRKAERQAAQLKAKLLQTGYKDITPMKLSTLLTDYLERTSSQIEPSTAASAAYRMQDFIAANGDLLADQITFTHCERFQQYCIARGLSPASVNSHIKMVRRIFSLAVRRGQLEANPFDGMQFIKVPQRAVRLLNENEINRLLRMSTPQILWKTRILIAKTAALRRGEILNLTANDIDYDKSRIIVQPKADSKTTWRWVVKDKERRILPMVQPVANLLARIQADLPDDQPYLLLTPERYQRVMYLKKTGRLIDRVAKCPDNNFRRNWLVLCKKAGVEKATFHDLRATCITEWLEQGVMPHEVQRLAGHSSVETTMRYYVGIRDTMIDKARQASLSALGQEFVTVLSHQPKNDKNGDENPVLSALQTLVNAGVIKIGATGLEPATS
ncbi:MAG: tyrosine-type recombinase/integrase [Sedimentisphaerales bacterium]|nr:tyrosine-type recombinase/integrase [Sedimentisphaerales bacterium]